MTSVSCGRPSVSVPVLSTASTVSRPACSSAVAWRNSTPWRAPRPTPTITAAGVARPSAHGQAITSTATACMMARSQSPLLAPTASRVATAMASTAGTKYPEITSASRWIGAFEPCASPTWRMMAASWVSAPTPVARRRSTPCRLRVAAYTGLSTPLLTGALSPVSRLSSTLPWPSITTPSTGALSPSRTHTTSPTRTSATGTSCTAPSRSTRAVVGASLSRASMAPAVCRRARCSSHLPSSTRVITDTLASKYTWP